MNSVEFMSSDLFVLKMLFVTPKTLILQKQSLFHIYGKEFFFIKKKKGKSCCSQRIQEKALQASLLGIFLLPIFFFEKKPGGGAGSW